MKSLMNNSACMTSIALLGVLSMSTFADDCFDPLPCQDSNGNGVRDSCEDLGVLGTGLIGSYYVGSQDSRSAMAPLERVASRLDATIDFENAPDFPPEGVPDDKFWVRWEGTVTPSETGAYEFATLNDDGARVRVGDNWIIESWEPQSGGDWHTGMIDMVAGEPMLLVVEYYDDGGSQKCRLHWAPPGETDRVIIPTSALSPSTDLNDDGYPDFNVPDCDNDGLSDAAEIGLGLAEDCDDNCVPDDCDLVEDDVLAYYRFESNPLLEIDSSGNDHHLIASDDVDYSSDRPVAEVPRNGLADFGSVQFNRSGQMRYPDPEGYFALGGQDFTVEAWVKVTSPSSVDGPEQRQYLIQKKNASGDINAGFQILAQGGNIAAAGNWYGKSSYRSGNELVARFGNGSENYSIISRLQLVDNDHWYHVSVAVDSTNQRIRFEVDGMFEWQDLPNVGHVPGTGALRIGAHSTSTGDLDQQLAGRIDELRIMRGITPLGRMLTRTTTAAECPKDSCLGDFDDTGVVDGADLTQLLGAWGSDDPEYDLDGVPGVNGADLTVLLGNWGPCP